MAKKQADTVYKVVEVAGVSEKSWEDAGRATRNSFRANFRGCGLNQSSNFAALPTGGGAAHTTSRPVQKRQCSVSSKLL